RRVQRKLRDREVPEVASRTGLEERIEPRKGVEAVVAFRLLELVGKHDWVCNVGVDEHIEDEPRTRVSPERLAAGEGRARLHRFPVDPAKWRLDKRREALSEEGLPDAGRPIQ